jgi:hypothetical protein
MVIAASTACIASFFWPLIIGGGIGIFRRYDGKILKNASVKKSEEKIELQKSETKTSERDVEIVIEDKSVV